MILSRNGLFELGMYTFLTMRGSLHEAAYRNFLVLLKKARLESGLTQSEVAHRLGRRQSYVSKCESGERRVDAVELAQFAKLYKKRLEFFLGK